MYILSSDNFFHDFCLLLGTRTQLRRKFNVTFLTFVAVVVALFLAFHFPLIPLLPNLFLSLSLFVYLKRVSLYLLKAA